MRILHVSDTHLGYSAYHKVDPESGLNQREVDVYRAFERFVDRAIDLVPDAVIHSGDFFDSVRPSNRALHFAQRQLLRLSEADIPTVIIAGNHSAPRLRETGCAHQLFDHLDNIHPVYRERLERVVLGDMTVHALPHSEGDRFQEQLGLFHPDGSDYNVGMMHAGVRGHTLMIMEEFNEREVEDCHLDEDFDYIGLGHFHQHAQVAPNARFSGSTERFHLNDAGKPKGFLEVDLDTGTKEFHRLPIRPMVYLGMVDASEMDGESIQEEVEAHIEGEELTGAIALMRVINVSATAYRTIDFHRIDRMASPALHFERKFEVRQEDPSGHGEDAGLDSLEKEFVRFLETHPRGEMDKESVQSRGLEYLNRRLETSD